MKKIIVGGSSDKAFDELNNIYKDFKKIKKITTYLYEANFLLDEYPIIDKIIFSMIIEDFDGTLVYVSGLNCGYIGTAPRTTQKLLMKIGFSKEVSERLILNKGLKIEFIDAGDVNTALIKTDSLFEVNHYILYDEIKNNKIEEHDRLKVLKYYISDEMKIDIVNRRIYFINPQKDLAKFFVLINLIDVIEFKYYIGRKSDLENSMRIEELFINKKILNNYNGNGVNLVLKCDKFDIICFVNYEDQLEFISVVYREIFKEDLYEKIFIKDEYIFTKNMYGKVKLILKILKRTVLTKSIDIYGEKIVSKNIKN